VSTAAVTELAEAIARGRGSLAQFSHPDLGGSGQWMRSGMLMIGDTFNDRLKARVAALCIDVADALGEHPARKKPTSALRPLVANPFRRPINRGLPERHALRVLPEQQAAGD
jgi:hypothetical protein